MFVLENDIKCVQVRVSVRNVGSISTIKLESPNQNQNIQIIQIYMGRENKTEEV